MLLKCTVLMWIFHLAFWLYKASLQSLNYTHAHTNKQINKQPHKHFFSLTTLIFFSYACRTTWRASLWRWQARCSRCYTAWYWLRTICPRNCSLPFTLSVSRSKHLQLLIRTTFMARARASVGALVHFCVVIYFAVFVCCSVDCILPLNRTQKNIPNVWIFVCASLPPSSRFWSNVTANALRNWKKKVSIFAWKNAKKFVDFVGWQNSFGCCYLL